MYQAHPPHQCDCVPQDEEEHDDGVEVDAESIGPREHEEIVGLGAITIVPKPVKINHCNKDFALGNSLYYKN